MVDCVTLLEGCARLILPESEAFVVGAYGRGMGFVCRLSAAVFKVVLAIAFAAAVAVGWAGILPI